jgi:hypothetical protein
VEGPTKFADIVKEKVEGMSSKLLEEVQNRLKTLKGKAFGYRDVIICSELEQCVKKSSSLV